MIIIHTQTQTNNPLPVSTGMMDGAYFTSRKDILDFFNSLLSMNLSKIEDTASGAVACQLMDYMFPGSIPMKRVNWEAKSDFQYIENYKILQAAFTKSNVQKQIDVDRLIRAKYQDNLEFCQWLKAFFEHAAPASREDYDPLSRRQMGKGGKRLDDIFLPRGMRKNGARPSIAVRNSNNGMSGGGGRVSSGRGSQRPLSSRPSSAASGSIKSNSGRPLSVRGGGGDVRSSSSVSSVRSSILPRRNTDSADAELLKKNAELKRRNAEIELTLDNIEKERDFYFDKVSLHLKLFRFDIQESTYTFLHVQLFMIH